MKTKYKIIIGLGLLILISFLLYVVAWFMAPGSYARAEIYEMNISEDSLIQIIKDFKIENPDLGVSQSPVFPESLKYDLHDGRSDSTDFWYHIYFYYPDKNQIVYTWVRQDTRTTTHFAFVGLNKGITLGNWKMVNESFWWWKNKPIKNEFENRILNKIEEKIKETKIKKK
jgi:hypothetical protein